MVAGYKDAIMIIWDKTLDERKDTRDFSVKTDEEVVLLSLLLIILNLCRRDMTGTLWCKVDVEGC